MLRQHLPDSDGAAAQTVKHLKDGHVEILDEADRAIAEYITKLTFESWTMTQGDVDSLRRCGFSDTQVLEITLVASLFNFITRVVDALGVVSNPEREAWQAYLYGESLPQV